MKSDFNSVSSLKVLGVRVHTVQISDAVRLMSQFIDNSNTTCRQIVTTGMHGIMEAQKDTSFKSILNSADLFVPDGISLIWAMRRQGFSIKKSGTGPEILREFFLVSSEKGYRNFFYGDTAETLEMMTNNLKFEFPQLKIVGSCSPPFRQLTPDEDNEIIEMINHTNADVLWVGLGCPKQERWIFEHKEQLNVPVAIGVGASFKFYSGLVRRAPIWLRNLGFEWLWRLLSEPRRIWPRVFLDSPRFLYHVTLELIGLKKYG